MKPLYPKATSTVLLQDQLLNAPYPVLGLCKLRIAMLSHHFHSFIPRTTPIVAPNAFGDAFACYKN